MSKKGKINEIANSRYIEKIYPSKKSFKELLGKQDQITCYIGIDPTGPDLHLGHSTNFLFLKKLHELGHKLIFLVGDFTARIGDPTGKSSKRKALTKKEIEKNCKDYKSQAINILDFDNKDTPIEMKYNSDWYENMKLKDVIKLMAKTTHGQLIKRDMFQERIKANKEIHFHELIYPLLQGLDSVVLEADLEVGGNDQTFNMMMGRSLVKQYQDRDKFVISTKLLVNPETGKKMMSKSEGSYVSLQDSPKEMFGKIMSLPDEAIIPCFELCTEVEKSEIDTIKKKIEKNQENPRNLKAKLARTIIEIYHDEKQAKEAEKEFNRIFRKDKIPSDIPTLKTKKDKYSIIEVLSDSKMVGSNSEAKRLIESKAVKIIRDEEQVISNWEKEISTKEEPVIKVGKRRFVKIIKK